MPKVINDSSGIYCIRNRQNGKLYIGSTKALDIRKRNHFNYLKRNVHKTVHLQNAYNKYGEGKHHSEETKLKMSAASKGRHKSAKARENMSIAQKGKQWSAKRRASHEAKKARLKEINKGDYNV